MFMGDVSPSWQHLVTKILGVITSIAASLVWLATLGTLFGLWARDHFVRYESDDGEVAYISNVGAAHKAVFIVGAALTGTFYVLTLLFTKLCFDLETRRRFKRGVSIVSIVFGFISGLSLLLLAVFDSIHHKGAHYTFTGLFIVFTLLSAITTVVHRYTSKQFNVAVGLRVLFIGLVIPLAITFVVMGLIGGNGNRSNLKSVAASLEWSIALLFVAYLGLFALDLLLYN